MSATVGGATIVDGLLTLPKSGAWLLDATLPDVPAPSGRVAVVVQDIALIGTVVRSKNFAGITRCRVVGGANGWCKRIPKKAYRSPAGLQLAPLLADAARECGETMGPVPAQSVGPHYGRIEGPASNVLMLAGREWWIDDLGVTQVAARSTAPTVAPYQLTNFDGAIGRAEITADELTTFRPGRVLNDASMGSVSINAVVWAIKPGSVKGMLWIA